jgi:3-oxoacyl-[acyl-carrier protein] reductase
MGDSLKGKVAIVTGSGQGVGRGIALGLAAEGAKVVTNNRKPGSTGFAIMNEKLVKALPEDKQAWFKKHVAEDTGDAETTAAKIRSLGGDALAFFGDMTDFEMARKIAKTAKEHYGKIDILVNVIGTFAFGPVWEMSEETWDHVNLVKPKAHFNTIRHVLPYMMEQKWGRILNCSSGAATGIPNQTNYAAANAGVLGLTWSTAMEVWPYGITCNAFAPGAYTRATFELEAYVMAQPKEKRPFPASDKFLTMMENTPGPEELAPFLAYLCTDEGAKISGSLFFVTGNMISLYNELKFDKTLNKEGKRWTFEELKKKAPPALFQGYQSPAMPNPRRFGGE